MEHHIVTLTGRRLPSMTSNYEPEPRPVSEASFGEASSSLLPVLQYEAPEWDEPEPEEAPVQNGEVSFEDTMYLENDQNHIKIEDISKEQWDSLADEIEKVKEFYKQFEANKETETDEVRTYRNILSTSIKIYNRDLNGFRVLHKHRTEKEQLKIDRSKFEILKFAYTRHPMLPDRARNNLDWNHMEMNIIESVDYFIDIHDATSFRPGALSVAIDFDDFPPKLTWRGNGNETTLLRPVVVDGVAVLKATVIYDDWFPFIGHCHPETMIYDENLNLPVKAIFDVIMNFMIRGHKTVVYLPTYYKRVVTIGRISKVDDLVAFRKLIDLGFIEFLDTRKEKKWFDVVADKADQKGAVFVSSVEYRNRKEKIKTKFRTFASYEKPSQRIITPCFLNTEDDRLMVLEPIIRFKESEKSPYQVIPSEMILHFDEPDDDRTKLGEQLYLDRQIDLICALCQLYPMKALHKVGIQQLLHLVVRAESGFEMSSMDMDSYLNLFDRFVYSDNNSNHE